MIVDKCSDNNCDPINTARCYHSRNVYEWVELHRRYSFTHVLKHCPTHTSSQFCPIWSGIRQKSTDLPDRIPDRANLASLQALLGSDPAVKNYVNNIRDLVGSCSHLNSKLWNVFIWFHNLFLRCECFPGFEGMYCEDSSPTKPYMTSSENMVTSPTSDVGTGCIDDGRNIFCLCS